MDPMLPSPFDLGSELPQTPESPDDLVGDVEWLLNNIERCSSVDDAHTGYEFDSSGVLCKTAKPVGQFSMEQASTRRLLSLCPVLRSSRKNATVLAYFLALCNELSALLMVTGGEWFRAPMVLFMELDHMVFRLYQQRAAMFSEFCERVSAGRAGDQFSVSQAAMLAKALLEGSGREVYLPLFSMAEKTVRFANQHVGRLTVPGTEPPPGVARLLRRVKTWAKRLKKQVLEESRVAVAWDRGAIEMAHAFGYDGIGVRERLATVVPEYCVETDMLLARQLPVAG